MLPRHDTAAFVTAEKDETLRSWQTKVILVGNAGTQSPSQSVRYRRSVSTYPLSD
jgi:hypothetical protein